MLGYVDKEECCRILVLGIIAVIESGWSFVATDYAGISSHAGA